MIEKWEEIDSLMNSPEKRASGRSVAQGLGFMVVFMFGLVSFLVFWMFVGVVLAWKIYAEVLIVSVVAFFGFFVGYGIYSHRGAKKHLRFLRENYRYVYRVLALPPETAVCSKAPLAEIMIGDYGWEAPPLADDGLIYLQGLTTKWNLVWHAGFQPDQIEKVCLKPKSQYDWTYASMINPPACPYPIVKRRTQHFGLPNCFIGVAPAGEET